MNRSWSNYWLALAGLLALPATLLSTTSAVAQDAANQADREAMFNKLDANSDGYVTRDEVPEAQQRMFDRLLKSGDKNIDSKLSKEEFLAATAEEPRRPQAGPGAGMQDGPGAEAIFRERDANKDGKLEESEVPEERREGFRMLVERFDADGDKMLSLAEFSKGLAFMRSGGAPQPPAGSPPKTASSDSRPPMSMAGGEGLFRALDTDNDGKLSRDEMYAAPEVLRKLDRNHDGVVDRAEAGGPPGDEMAAAGGRPGMRPGAPGAAGNNQMAEVMTKRFKDADANNDGKLSKDEAPDRMKENFDRIDTNKDGFIDEQELKAMIAMFARGAGGQPGQPTRPGRPGQTGQPGADRGEQMLKQLDKNNDGKLSKDEVPERMQENFDRLDRNNDGFIDAEELKALGQRRPQENN